MVPLCGGAAQECSTWNITIFIYPITEATMRSRPGSEQWILRSVAFSLSTSFGGSIPPGYLQGLRLTREWLSLHQVAGSVAVPSALTLFEQLLKYIQSPRQ